MNHAQRRATQRRKGTPRVYDRHHRKCRSHGKSEHPENVVLVRKDEHRAFHLLFADMRPHEVAARLSALWIDPEWVLVAQRR